ncbi:MAG: hypothetical protein FD167_2738 [bacterium]|nr:MAG: hypothetical protein FD167_2738 [bacterium]
MSIFYLITTALYVIAIYDILNSKRRTLGEKIVLIVAVVAFPVLGSAIYLLAFREKE